MLNKNQKKSIIFISNMYPSKTFPAFGTFVKTNEEHLKEQGIIIKKKIVIDEKGGTRVIKIQRYLKFFYSTFSTLLLSKYDYAYIHYLTYSTLPLLLLLPFKKIKYVVNIHGDDLTGSGKIHKVMGLSNKYIIKRSFGVIVPSELFKDKLLSIIPTYNYEKVHISHSGGVNVSLFKPDKTLKTKKNFIYLSRIEEGKGWEVLLKAVALLSGADKEICVDVYGDGFQKEEFLRMVNELNISNNINYKGALHYSQVPKILNGYKYFIFPTYRESLGLAFLEAMACGIPAIVSNIQPLNSISHAKASLFFTPGNEKELSQKMEEAISICNSDYNDMSDENIKISQLYSADKSKIGLARFLDNAFNNS